MFRDKMRYRLLAWLFVITLISMMDRVNIGIAAPAIMKDLSMPASLMGIIMSGFTIGFAFSNFAAGFLIEKISCRILVTVIIVLWSIMTIFTGLANAFLILLIVRIAFGLFEGPMPPANTTIVNNWMFPSERGIASGLWLTAIPVGSFAGNMASATLVAYWGWRWMFIIFGVAGFLIALINWFMMRDRPEECPGITSVELESIRTAKEQEIKGDATAMQEMGNAKLLKNGTVWVLFLVAFALFTVLWSNVNWLPTYFVKAKGVDIITAGFYASIPMMFAIFGPIILGWSSDRVRKRGRSLVVHLAFLFVVPSLVVAVNSESLVLCIGGFAFSTFLIYGSLSLMMSVPMEIFKGPDYAKVVGILLSGGSLGGIFGAILVGYVLQYTGSFNMAYYVFAGLAFAASFLCILLIREEIRKGRMHRRLARSSI